MNPVSEIVYSDAQEKVAAHEKNLSPHENVLPLAPGQADLGRHHASIHPDFAKRQDRIKITPGHKISPSRPVTPRDHKISPPSHKILPLDEADPPPRAHPPLFLKSLKFIK